LNEKVSTLPFSQINNTNILYTTTVRHASRRPRNQLGHGF
jgi:hypothetical protein